MNKYELQDKQHPRRRIVVDTWKQVRELEAHGWQRVQANVFTKETKK